MSMDLLPFDSVTECPKCGRSTKGYRVEYSADVKVSAGEGFFVPVSTRGDAPIPHLEKRCPHCHFGWLEETKNAAADRGNTPRNANPPPLGTG